MNLDFMANLPALTERPRAACPKGTFVPLKQKAKKLKDRVGPKAEKLWRDAIWARDFHQCQCCHIPVQRTEHLIPNRGECHHLKSRRIKAVRNDQRNGVLVCRECHTKLTENKLRVRQPKALMFIVDGAWFINGNKELTFMRAA